jgi:16S rRNA (adenine1518-N6/adenine1519-N6)-dimethyltransferase
MGTKYGQNFLIDNTVADQIIDALCLHEGDSVLEIGPGNGVLSQRILPRVKHFYAVEVDWRLAENIRSKFAGTGKLELFNMDFLKFDFAGLKGPVKLAANLPYYVATPIIEKILPATNWETAVFMLQKEVADRICAGTDTKSYGVLSLVCQHYAACETMLSCGPESFSPAPKVWSTVIKLTNRFQGAFDMSLLKVIRAAFSQRRKTILNALSGSLNLPKETVNEALIRSGITPSCRAENVSFKLFQSLTQNLNI